MCCNALQAVLSPPGKHEACQGSENSLEGCAQANQQVMGKSACQHMPTGILWLVHGT